MKKKEDERYFVAIKLEEENKYWKTYPTIRIDHSIWLPVKCRTILALLCTTAQHSYYRHVGVRRPSFPRKP